MHLVFQGEVKSDVLHSLLSEGLCAWLVLLLLDVFDHVWEPHCQTVVAAEFLEEQSRWSEPKKTWGEHEQRFFFEPYIYLKDMVNQTAMSMKVVRLYSGLKVARMLFFICEP